MSCIDCKVKDIIAKTRDKTDTQTTKTEAKAKAPTNCLKVVLRQETASRHIITAPDQGLYPEPTTSLTQGHSHTDDIFPEQMLILHSMLS